MTDKNLTAGFLLFPGLTQLDLTAPFEVLSHLPGCRCLLIAAEAAPVSDGRGMSIVPASTFAGAPKLDLICVPGGPGTMQAAADPATVAFLRQAAAGASWITSVCTGSLILGAAGLLRGKRATCHWAYRHLLTHFGANPVAERVVEDGNIITGGGVTAGLDFALTVVARIAGRRAAELIQLGLEYDPAPPFDTGCPERAGPTLVEAYRASMAGRLAEREAIAVALGKEGQGSAP
jgi:cyclohexyl-isocyanide hydratase